MGAPKDNRHGLSSNPENINRRGIKGPRGPKSPLKRLAKELLDRVPKAMEIIDACLDGAEVKDKDQLQVARWICERAVTTQSAAVAEEKARLAIKKEVTEETEDTPEEVVAEVPVKRFSLHMLPVDKKD